jgi:hypothetical protein
MTMRAAAVVVLPSANERRQLAAVTSQPMAVTR